MQISSLFHNTRPEGALLPQEEAAFSLLEKLEIPYDRVSSDPADNMEKCAAVSEVLGVPICKNLFLCNRQKTQFYLLCMGPDKPFHTKDLSHQIGSARLSFAPEEELWEHIPPIHEGKSPPPQPAGTLPEAGTISTKPMVKKRPRPHERPQIKQFHNRV